MESRQRLRVSRRDVLGTAGVTQRRVLRANPWVVEAGRDRVRVEHLPVAVGEDRRTRAVQDRRTSGSETRRTGRLDADEANGLVLEEAGEEADRVGAAAHTGDDHGSHPLPYPHGVEPLRVGLVGAGPWAKLCHVPMLEEHPDIRLVGGWARRPEAMATLVGPERTVRSYDELLDQVEAVVFCVPPDVQAELAPEAAARGRHLFLEKPLAFDVRGSGAGRRGRP